MDTLSSTVTRRLGGDRGIKAFVTRHKKALSVAALVLGAFYWSEVRPVRINATCTSQAGTSARALLVSKAEVATDSETKKSYQQLVDKSMYLRSDYESYYKKCLREYGIFI